MRKTAESKRAWERKFRATGARMVGVRLSAVASDRLAELREMYDATDRDVIEGLLLGNIRPGERQLLAIAAELGCSVAEAKLLGAPGGVQSSDATGQNIESLAHHMRQRDPGRGSRTDWGNLMADVVQRSRGDKSADRRRRGVSNNRRLDAADRGE